MPIQNIGADIVQAFLAGRRIKLQQDALRQQQEFAQQKFEQDQQQFEQELKRKNEEFKLTQALDQAKYNKSLFDARVKGGEALAQGHLSPTTVTDEAYEAEIPEIGTIRIPNPEIRKNKDSERKINEAVKQFTALTLPTAQRAGQVAQAQNPALMERTEKQQAGQLENQKIIKELEAKEADKRFKERVYLQDRRDANAMARAQVRRKSNEVDFAPEETNVAIKNLADGSTTLEELTKSGYTQSERKHLIQEMGRRNLKPLNNQTKTSLQQMQAVKNIFEQVTRLRDMIKESPYESTIPFSTARGLAGRINAQLGTMASQVGGQKGAISLKDVKAMEAYVAKFSYGIANPKVNDEIVNDFEKLLRSKQNSLMPNFSPAQKRILNETYNLLPTHILIPKSQIKLDEWEDQ